MRGDGLDGVGVERVCQALTAHVYVSELSRCVCEHESESESKNVVVVAVSFPLGCNVIYLVVDQQAITMYGRLVGV